MTQDEYARTLDELDALLNNPDVAMDPGRVWALLADLSGRDPAMPGARQARAVAGKSVRS